MIHSNHIICICIYSTKPAVPAKPVPAARYFCITLFLLLQKLVDVAKKCIELFWVFEFCHISPYNQIE